MSHTTLARNEKRVDYYPTPAWCVHRLLEACELPGGCWLEPAVGEGAIVRAIGAVRDDVTWITIDVRPEVEADVVADFWAFGEALVPITLDDHVFDGWASGKQSTILARKVADFRNWKDHDSFEAALGPLIRALRAAAGRESEPPDPKL